ncbi:MAG: NADH-quinone oxidoreductase subunit N [Planctomycetes bacterium]|nr:NADH-quinone oxidoreductase subunit N [Planctomycetota bacterium]
MDIDTTQLLAVFSTEVWLGALALLLILVDLVVGRGRLTGPADMVRMVALAGLAIVLWHTFTLEPNSGATWGTLDTFAIYFKRFFVGTALVTLIVSQPYEQRLEAGRGEFPALVVFTTMGMTLLASVSDFVTLFVGLELVTVTLFMLAAWRAGLPRSIEAGMKFVIVGAIAAAFLVYGTAFVYGTTGSLEFSAVRAAVGAGSIPMALKFGLLLVIVGLSFKIGAVPFHLWIPDVYQGAPTPVTAFLSVGSKAAGVVLMMRLVFSVLGPGAAQWVTILAGLSALTLLMGNLGAISQTDLKRFLGYSGISHAGYLLLAMSVGPGILVGTHGAEARESAASAILFYLVAYLLANTVAFLVIIIVSRTDDDSHMDRINGLAQRKPFLAFALTVSMLSLAGVPPFAGFVAKFMILRAAMADPALLPFVVLALVMVVVSLYYYLCILKRMYFRDPIDEGVLEEPGPAARVLLYAGVLGSIALGVYFNPIVEAANLGAHSLFG